VLLCAIRDFQMADWRNKGFSLSFAFIFGKTASQEQETAYVWCYDKESNHRASHRKCGASQVDYQEHGEEGGIFFWL
jgi:hypothetical protein